MIAPLFIFLHDDDDADDDYGLCSVTVMTFDLLLKGRGFNTHPFRRQLTPLGRLFALVCLGHQAV